MLNANESASLHEEFETLRSSSRHYRREVKAQIADIKRCQAETRTRIEDMRHLFRGIDQVHELARETCAQAAEAAQMDVLKQALAQWENQRQSEQNDFAKL